MQVAEIELYKILKTKFSDYEAESIVASLGHQLHERFEERKNEFATKEDLTALKEELKGDIATLRGELKEDMAALKVELKGDIATLRGELKEDMAALKVELKEDKGELKGDIARLEIKIAEYKAEIIKWMFIFWVGQLAATIAIVKLFFH